MVPLSIGKPNQSYTIVKLTGSQRARSEALGFVTGETVNVVQSAHGNLIVSLRDSRYAISKEQAGSILVEEFQC